MKHAIPLFVLLLSAASGAAGELYKWVDEHGNVHYSDTPVEGARELELPAPTTFDAPEVEPPPPSSRRDEPAADGESDYTRFGFISPKQDQVFWNTGGNIPVQLDIEPRLHPDDRVELHFNGEPVALQGLGTTLTGVYRGTYTVRAAIIGPDGQERVSAGPVTFHVKQHSIANPQRPTRPR